MPIAKAKMGSAALILQCNVSMHASISVQFNSILFGSNARRGASVVTIHAVKVGRTWRVGKRAFWLFLVFFSFLSHTLFLCCGCEVELGLRTEVD